MNYLKKIAIFFVLIALLAACSSSNSSTCMKESKVVAGVALYKCEYNSEQEVFTSSPITETLTVQGVGSDSVLYASWSVSSIELPLHINVDSTQFVVQRDSTGTDTLTIFHTNEQNFISMACGCFVYHTITDVRTTTNQIDSAVIYDARVENISNTHLRLYFKIAK